MWPIPALKATNDYTHTYCYGIGIPEQSRVCVGVWVRAAFVRAACVRVCVCPWVRARAHGCSCVRERACMYAC